MKKFLVIDGNSIVNRAFYGVRPLTNSAGLPTNALYGMFSILSKQINEVKPDYAAVAFDLPAPTFRHKAYPEYKAGRKKMPPELAQQLPYAKRLCECMGFTVMEKEGYEADDILGTVSAMCGEQGVHSYVLTGDRDSLQLISDSVTVLLATNSDTVSYDRDRFFEKYGVEPQDFVDVKALMGDSSDNIPGVAGIGEKTAFKLISQFKTLENVYADLDGAGLGKSARQKMEDGRESAFMSRSLATIVKDVPIGRTLNDMAYCGSDKEALRELLKELEFMAFIKKLGLDAAEAAPVTAPAEREEDGQSREEGKRDALMTEPIRISQGDLRSIGAEKVALYYEQGEGAIFDGEKCYVFDIFDVSQFIAEFSSAQKRVVLYDSKKYIKDFSLCGAGIEVEDDVILASYVADPSRGAVPIEDMWAIFGSGYCGEGASARAYMTWELCKVFTEKLAENNGIRIYREIELPLARVLADMELTGFQLDISALRGFLEKLYAAEKECEQRIYMLAGREFNVNSPKQLGTVLFEELGIPGGKKGKTGYHTGAEVLESLKDDYPIVSEILEFRGLSKLRSTYCEGLLRAADESGRVHTVFGQTTAVTGRLASSEPNLQNIPVRTEMGREMRRFFVASDKSRVLIDADYSQIELRLLAHIAADEVMTKAFISGEDIHTLTASQVFGVPLDAVTGEMRKRAKAVNFGIVYGIGEFSLAKDIGVTRKEAKAYIDSYFEKYRGIEQYLSAAVESARALGYVETVFGRRRYIPEISSSKAMLRAFGERVAMNSPIQGSSADIIKIAMINVSRALKSEGLDAKLILQIHDELIVESSRADAEKAAQILKREMEKAVELTVPLTVDLQTGDSWYDCH